MPNKDLEISQKLYLENWLAKNKYTYLTKTDFWLHAKQNFKEEEISYLKLAYELPYNALASFLLTKGSNEVYLTFAIANFYKVDFKEVIKRISDVKEIAAYVSLALEHFPKTDAKIVKQKIKP